MPIIFVVGISMIKDIAEDYGRHKQDGKENSMLIQAMPRGGDSW